VSPTGLLKPGGLSQRPLKKSSPQPPPKKTPKKAHNHTLFLKRGGGDFRGKRENFSPPPNDLFLLKREEKWGVS